MLQVQICGLLWTQNRIGIQLIRFRGLCPWPPCAVFRQFVCYCSVTVIDVYWGMDTAIIWFLYMVSNCCLSHHWRMTGPWKNASLVLESPGKVLEIFVTKRVGTLCVGHTDVLCRNGWNDCDVLTLGPRNHVIDGVMIRPIYLQPQGVTSRRCNLLPDYFRYLLLLWRSITVVTNA